MNLPSRFVRWAFLLCAAALVLSGCGRKGPLDLPPTASSASSAAPAPAATDTEIDNANRPSVFNPTYGSEAAPTASRGGKKPFVLDPLLGN